MLFHQSKPVHHGRVGKNSPFSTKSGYANFLCFTVSIQFNHLNPQYNKRNYSPQQEELYEFVQSLHEKGMGYRTIAKHLNELGVKTHKGSEWKTQYVYSVIKRHKERQERLELRYRKYEPVISKMWVEYDEV